MSRDDGTTTVVTGLQHLVEKGLNTLPPGRLAVLTHQCAVDKNGTHLLQHLSAARRTPELVLSPEHGLWSTHQDMEAVGAQRDQVFGLPVNSLYGEDEQSLDPSQAILRGMDVLVADMQDVGARYYTYAASLLRCMRVAQDTGTRIVVLDRPNPIGGEVMEGNLVAPGFESFVGDLSVPNRHGMTLGELMLFASRQEGLNVDLEIIKVHGWTRHQFYDDTGLLWIQPSPNMPTPATAAVYPGMCLLEGTNLSEGRGTTTPFELFGAPWINAQDLVADVLDEVGTSGFVLTPAAFRPQFQKYAGKVCAGARVHVTQPRRFRSLPLALAILKHCLKKYPRQFAWRSAAYEFVTDRLAIDLLLGDETPRRLLEGQRRVTEIVESMTASAGAFESRREAVLLY